MTLDSVLLEKSKSWNYIKLEFENNLIEEYISVKDTIRKRELILLFFDNIFKKYFDKFDNSFQFLTGLKKVEEDFLYKYLYYRDHFIHLFQVFLLGCYIIESASNEGFPIGKLYDIDPERLIRTWFLISFFHDIGYLAEKLIILGKEIQKIYFNNISGLELTEFKINTSENLNKIFNDYLEIIAEGILKGEIDKFVHGNDLEPNPKLEIILNELKEYYHRRDHGVMSALFLYYTIYLDIDFIDDEDISEEFLQDLNIACSAIAIHSIEKTKNIHINFEKNDLGCLLILCDNLQEWNRPRMKELNFYEFDIWECLEISIDASKKIIFINFQLNDKYPLEDIKKHLRYIFNEFERIFFKTFIKGPNFSFSYKNDSIDVSLKAEYSEDRKSYIVTNTLP